LEVPQQEGQKLEGEEQAMAFMMGQDHLHAIYQYDSTHLRSSILCSKNNWRDLSSRNHRGRNIGHRNRRGRDRRSTNRGVKNWRARNRL
jgi:hypothetical protein